MDYRRFNINLRQVYGLKCRKVLFKTRVYAMVSIAGISSVPSKQRTPVGKYIGNNPTWDTRSSLRFYVEDSKLQQNHLILMIQLRCKQVLGGDKVIGEVYVPLKEVYDNCGGMNSTNYGYHQLMTLSGNRQVFIYFTYDFGETIRAAAAASVMACAHPSAPSSDDLGLIY